LARSPRVSWPSSSSRPIDRSPLVIAGIVMLVTLVQLFLRIDLVPPMAQPFFVPVILIVVGAYLLVEPRTH